MQRAAGNTNSTVVQDSSFLLHLAFGPVSSRVLVQISSISKTPISSNLLDLLVYQSPPSPSTAILSKSPRSSSRIKITPIFVSSQNHPRISMHFSWYPKVSSTAILSKSLKSPPDLQNSNLLEVLVYKSPQKSPSHLQNLSIVVKPTIISPCLFRCSAHRPANGVPPLGRGSAPFDVTWWLLPSLLHPLFQSCC